jgi:hypothetical protein
MPVSSMPECLNFEWHFLQANTQQSISTPDFDSKRFREPYMYWKTLVKLPFMAYSHFDRYRTDCVLLCTKGLTRAFVRTERLSLALSLQ